MESLKRVSPAAGQATICPGQTGRHTQHLVMPFPHLTQQLHTLLAHLLLCALLQNSSTPTDRNKEPILAALKQHLPQEGLVLEVASGTGQHAAHFAAAVPAWQWQPTDVTDEGFDSIRAYTVQLPNVLPPQLLDASAPPQQWPCTSCAAVYVANVTHISPWWVWGALPAPFAVSGLVVHCRPLGLPWCACQLQWHPMLHSGRGISTLCCLPEPAPTSVAVVCVPAAVRPCLPACCRRVTQGLVAGAGQLLQPGGVLFIYGPFKVDGAFTSDSNESFHHTLVAQNPEWGYRDVADVAAAAEAAGLRHKLTLQMPANNLGLVFVKQ